MPTIRERLIETLGGTRDYVSRIPRVNLPEETSLISVSNNEEFTNTLEKANLTKGQRAAIIRILGGCNWLPGSHEEVTIGDIRRMDDEQLGNLGSDIGRGWRAGTRTKKILRKLFG